MWKLSNGNYSKQRTVKKQINKQTKLKTNDQSCTDLWDSTKQCNNRTLWRKVEGGWGRKHLKKMANILQVLWERTLVYKFKRPANIKIDKYKRKPWMDVDFCQEILLSNLFFTEIKSKNSIIVLVDVKKSLNRIQHSFKEKNKTHLPN